jgi:hypothetical protein
MTCSSATMSSTITVKVGNKTFSVYKLGNVPETCMQSPNTDQKHDLFSLEHVSVYILTNTNRLMDQPTFMFKHADT